MTSGEQMKKSKAAKTALRINKLIARVTEVANDKEIYDSCWIDLQGAIDKLYDAIRRIESDSK